MAKRFTDTEKWKRPWFRSLTSKEKLIWVYLCDDCDHAGIWFGDFDLMSFHLGFRVSEEDVLGSFFDKVEKYGDKFLITKFFEFQYGQTKEGFAARISASKKIEQLKSQGSPDPVGTLGEESPKGTSIGIGIGIGTGNSIKGGMGEKFDFESVYAKYPRKVGKQKGISKLKAQVRSREDFEALDTALTRYVQHCQREAVEQRFIKHFTTWVSEWRDWIDPATGSGQDFSTTSSGLSLAERLKIKEQGRSA